MNQDELSMRERGRLWVRLGIRTILIGGALLALFYVGKPLFSLCTPFLLALLLAWTLNPMIRGVQKRIGVPRGAISLILILLMLGLLGGAFFAFFYSVISELISLANNWQSVWAAMLEAFESAGEFLFRFFDVLPPSVVEFIEGQTERAVLWLQSSLSGFAGGLAGHAGNTAMALPPFAVALVVFIMGAYFIAADYPRLRLLVTERLNDSVRGVLRQVRNTAMAAFGGYVRAQLILSLVVLGILGVGFLLIGQPYALIIAFLLAVMDFIPIIGAGTVMVPWAVICLCTSDVRRAVQLLIIWGVILLFRRVAEPKIVGDQTGLSPILSLFSIYIGMRVAGVWGMVFAPMVCMVVINIVKTGIFTPLTDDIRLAARDTAALLKNRPKE